MKKIFLLIFLASQIGAQNLWVVLAADNADPVLGRSSSQDVELWKALLPAISADSGLELRLKVLEGSGLTSQTLRQELSGLTPCRDDTVIFYYTGAGVAGTSRNRWPKLYLPDRALLDLQGLFQELAAKDPRLLIVLAETGQTPVRQSRDGTIGTTPTPGVYRSLFRTSRGAVLACAASPGEAAMSYSEGNAFTVTFLEKVRTATDTDWQRLLNTVSSAVVADTARSQTPLTQFATLPTRPGPVVPASPVSPATTVYSNKDLSPFILIGEGWVFFQSGPRQWIVVDETGNEGFILNEQSRTMSHMLLKDSQGRTWRSPLPGTSLTEMRRQNGSVWEVVFLGVWRRVVYRYSGVLS